MEICATKIHRQASPFRNLECPGDSKGSHENTWVHCISLGLWRCWFERDLSMMRCTVISHIVDQKSLEVSICIYSYTYIIEICIDSICLDMLDSRKLTQTNQKRKKRQRRRRCGAETLALIGWVSFKSFKVIAVQMQEASSTGVFTRKPPPEYDIVHELPMQGGYAYDQNHPGMFFHYLRLSSIVFHLVAHCPSLFGFHFAGANLSHLRGSITRDTQHTYSSCILMIYRYIIYAVYIALCVCFHTSMHSKSMHLNAFTMYTAFSDF